MLSVVFALAACAGSPPRVASATAAASSDNVDVSRAADHALAMVGAPYRYGGVDPGGFDCSGLVDYVFRDVAGIDLPRTAREIGEINAPTVKRNQLESGDLVFFGHGVHHTSHIGIYVGRGRFVHAPNQGGTVRLDLLDAPYWNKHYSSAVRLPL